MLPDEHSGAGSPAFVEWAADGTLARSHDAELDDAELDDAELDDAELDDAELDDAELDDAELDDYELADSVAREMFGVTAESAPDGSLEPIQD